MNRLEFAQLLSSKSPNLETKDIIINFFDQYMFMYDFLDNVDDIFIINTDENNISFQLLFNDADDAECTLNKLNGIYTINIYENNYRISCGCLNEYTIIVTISR